MDTLTGSQRRYLRALAHELRPAVHVGKQGITQSLMEELDRALTDHELIKVKFVDLKDEKDALITDIESRASCHLAGLVGHIAILYRPHPDPEMQRIRLPTPRGSA